MTPLDYKTAHAFDRIFSVARSESDPEGVEKQIRIAKSYIDKIINMQLGRLHKKFVYIASPYTRGDTAINTRFQMVMFHRMLNDGIVLPCAPLWSHFQHLVFPRPYKDWTEYDLDMINRGTFDACLRMNATEESMNYLMEESKGADGEVEAFLKLKLPVFYNLTSLYDWAKENK